MSKSKVKITFKSSTMAGDSFIFLLRKIGVQMREVGQIEVLKKLASELIDAKMISFKERIELIRKYVDLIDIDGNI